MPKIHPVDDRQEVKESQADTSDNDVTNPREGSGANDVSMATSADQQDMDKREEEVKSSQSLKDLTSALLAPAVYVEPRSEKDETASDETVRRPTLERIDTQLKLKAIKALKSTTETAKFSAPPIAPIKSSKTDGTPYMYMYLYMNVIVDCCTCMLYTHVI